MGRGWGTQRAPDGVDAGQRLCGVPILHPLYIAHADGKDGRSAETPRPLRTAASGCGYPHRQRSGRPGRARQRIRPALTTSRAPGAWYEAAGWPRPPSMMMS
jgi:hypothetical protein